MSIQQHLEAIRGKFAHIDTCPISGQRIFFENAGGALTLKSVLETSTFYASIPDNQGRANAASQELLRTIHDSKQAIRTFFHTKSGQIFMGESGTELLFRLIRTAITNTYTSSNAAVISSTLEHPATRSAAQHWAKIYDIPHIFVPHNSVTGTVTARDYQAYLNKDIRVATIVHTSPVTGISADVQTIASEIRAIAPECYIIVDGIQHASHGLIDIDAYGIDGYVISGYKVFSRHGYGVAWASDRLSDLALEHLYQGPRENWEMGTRDTGAYATMRDVVQYFQWLGHTLTPNKQLSDRESILAAGNAIHEHERMLCRAMIFGTGNHCGLAEYPEIQILAGTENPSREGLVSFTHNQIQSSTIVAHFNKHGVRTHIRKDDYYSSNILKPLGKKDAVRVSLCHYNSLSEIACLLAAVESLQKLG